MRKGGRVAIMLPNLLQFPVALFGALRAGTVVVNVNPLYTPKELEHQLADRTAPGISLDTSSPGASNSATACRRRRSARSCAGS